jgi:uncharacterized membrane protein YhaH (DUF805 family)
MGDEYPGDAVTGRIFINYRRGDSQGAAGRLYDRLLQHFERDRLFMDVDAIEPGVDFVKSIEEQVATCSVFISVISPGWLAARTADGRPRLEEPNDYVRLEIEAALKREIRVIPVLVDGATMPQPSDLPASIVALAWRNAVQIAHHRFTADCDDLARGIKRALGIATEPPEHAASPASSSQHHQTRNLTWAEIFLSRHGRISRLQFLIGVVSLLAAVLALGAAILLAIHLVLGGADAQTEELTRKLSAFQDRLVTILGIATWWPTWALILKRLHDFEHGWRMLSLFIAMDITMTVLDLLEKDELSNQVTLFFLGIVLMVGAVKGTVGPNKYGPDPLAKPPL